MLISSSKKMNFVTINFCAESLLVLRDRNGELRGFFNVCQHRGHRLIEARRGNLEGMMICPYHAWAYGLDGRLHGAPNSHKVTGFDKNQIGLAQSRGDSCGGFVWVNTDLEAAPLQEYAPCLNEALRCYIPDLEAAVFFEGDFTHQAFNWKGMIDNILDSYHFPHAGPAHRELMASMKFEDFTCEVFDNWVVSHASPGLENPGGYPLDLSKSRGAVDGTAIIWVYPDSLISTLPVTRTFYAYTTPPFGPESTGIDISYYGYPAVQHLPITRTAIDWINQSVGGEDNHQVTSVHLGNKSRGFKGAHFMVDAELSRLSEHPGAAFHRRINESITAGPL